MIRALGRWGAPLMRERTAEEEFRALWLSMPVEMFLDPPAAGSPASTIEVRTADQPVLIEARDGAIGIRPGSAPAVDLVLSRSRPSS